MEPRAKKNISEMTFGGGIFNVVSTAILGEILDKCPIGSNDD